MEETITEIHVQVCSIVGAE